MLQLLAVLVVVAIAIGCPVLMIRGMRQMWRDKRNAGTFGSGVIGVFSELDRVVRPSIVHVEEARESVIKQEDEIGGE